MTALRASVDVADVQFKMILWWEYNEVKASGQRPVAHTYALCLGYAGSSGYRPQGAELFATSHHYW